jgi:hypothetical protein
VKRVLGSRLFSGGRGVGAASRDGVRGGRPGALALGLFLAFSAACDGGFPGAGQRPEGFRLVQGRLALPTDQDLIGRQVTGLQVAGLALDGQGGAQAFPSAIFNPASVRDEAAFSTFVEGTKSFVIVLQVPVGNGRGPGSFLGLLRFDGNATGSLVPPGLDDIDLGRTTIQRGARLPADSLLIPGAPEPPLAQIDTDGDGVNDLVDDDDDGDGIPDATDPDNGNDGIDDVDQLLSALPDANNDGVPDALQR